MPTLQTAAAELTREMGAVLFAAVEAMPADKQTWKPLDEGRDAFDQLLEVTGINLVAAESLRTTSNPVFSEDAQAKMKAELDTVPKALAALKSSCDLVVSALETLTDEDLDKLVTLPFRGGVVRPLSWLAMLPARHMSYHWGQINYIQTLYGDKEMHLPK